MDDTTTTVRASIDVGLEPAAAFAVFGEELAAALAVMGIRFEAGPRGHVTGGEVTVGVGPVEQEADLVWPGSVDGEEAGQQASAVRQSRPASRIGEHRSGVERSAVLE